MAIDPLAPGKLFAQIFAARQAHEHERMNLLTQLAARKEEGVADREQQRLQREQQGQQFMESLGMQNKSLGLQERQLGIAAGTARTREALDISEAFEAGRIGPPEYEIGPGGSLQPKGKFFNTSDGQVFSFRSTEEQDRRKQEQHAKLQKAGIELQLDMIKGIDARTDLNNDSKQAMRSIIAGRNLSDGPDSMWSVGKEIGQALGQGDPARTIREQRKFYTDMQRTPSTMDAAHANYYRISGAVNLNKLVTEVHAQAATPYMYMAEAELRKNPDEYARIINNPMAYQAAVQAKLFELIQTKKIPASIPVDTGLDKPIMKDTLSGAMEAWHGAYDRMKTTKAESFIERKLRQSEEGPVASQPSPGAPAPPANAPSKFTPTPRLF